MHTNRLIREKSPYLLQHAHNPVDWYPWGEDAFEKARREQKPIFLSAGYSTCHWCHVMERESFEDERIAELLNRDFVPVKLDREERPDVDRVYMLYVQATTGGGGWPMSVWLTPDLKPFYGGTYFAPDHRYGRPGFGYLLEQLANAWREKRDEILAGGTSVLDQLAGYSRVESDGAEPGPQAAAACYDSLRRSYDERRGGFGHAPKFPRPSTLHFLFRYWQSSGETAARDMALHTLRAMAAGGMNDQLGGGFHRYSVDADWFVPHFEKMLYDQAQLASAFIEAWQSTADPAFEREARAILDYVLRDLRHPGGGFFSAEDADSVIDPARPHEKGEGAFYIWSHAELLSLLGPDLGPRAARYFGARENGNVVEDPHGEFTGRNILFLADAAALTPAEFESVRATLLEARANRIRPHLDDKILAGWNGLMISAFAQAGSAFADDLYLDAARQSLEFLQSRLWDGSTGTLLRRWREGEAAIPGCLEDYACFAQAALDLFKATLDPALLKLSRDVALALLERFEDREHGAFFAAQSSSDLVLRLKDDYDGAEPSGNTLAIALLQDLAATTTESAFSETAADALRAFSSRLERQAPTLPRMISCLLRAAARDSEITFHGESGPLRQVFFRHFRPFTAIRRGEGMEPAAILCEDFVCHPPAATEGALAELLA